MHVRKQLRDRIETELAGLSTTGPRVYSTKYFPTSAQQLPALAIYPEEEQSEHDADDYLGRNVLMVVAGLARAAKGVEDTLDTIAAEVETALSRQLNDLAIDCVPVATRFQRSGQGDAEIAVIEIVFRVFYRTAIGAPEVSL